MKAVSYEGPRKVPVSEHPKPKIKSPTDAILRVTTSGICGSDLHMYDGRTPLDKGTIVGHEIMGVIDQVGDAVESIQEGDRVVLPFNFFTAIAKRSGSRVEPASWCRRQELCPDASVETLCRDGNVRR